MVAIASNTAMMIYCQVAQVKSLKYKVKRMDDHVKHKYLIRCSVAIILVVVLGVVRGCKTASDDSFHPPVVSTMETGSARKCEGIGTA